MKLKEIPNNIVVHTPTEAEAMELLAILHENGYKWMSGTAILAYPWNGSIYYLNEKRITFGEFENFFNDGRYTILTLAEFKKWYCEEEEMSQLKDIDYATVCNGFNKDGIKDGDKVLVVRYDNANFNAVLNPVIATVIPEKNLEPYTEPETKPTEDMETKDYPPYLDRPKTVVETPKKELNLCELLKGHEDEEFFLTTMGTVIFHGVFEQSIQFKPHKTAKDTYLLKASGKMRENGVILAYPSRVLYEQYPLDPYTAWMKWQQEQKKFGLDIKIETYFEGKFGWEDCDDNVSCLHFHAPSDRDKCIEEIKAIIEKYNKK